ncbi:EscU/YscU/HrcU family type III secretion system export apparatus switch protein [Candidatus Arthromitus sp. SFB-rat-Yit]|uniref:EscU/YscU/HrcU family type III secretion system export apparatus switch protein n=1 Tax=Candidatus Arthromitus sp. SFB-rat-Yit TaxID=1041504 RepID=UPI000227A40A|nr:EscU/YscU/HrcU family type III secretion system export apparatus switch protein [Candidatus Arthromitus sp. SFB-rat-Yit]BAK81514.1 bifunctional flagellar biosynthesis proteins FliR/FlhB [Candidatus Arthromitus sp. SFB-rat-Yit]
MNFEIDYKILLLIIIRVSAFIVISQVFFPKGISNVFKIMFSVAFAFMLFPIIYQNVDIKLYGNEQYIFLILSETLIGLLIGIFVNLLFQLFSGIGSVLDSQGGFSSAQIFDPMTNNNSSVIEKIFYWISLSVFIIFNGHHYFIRAFIFSYEKIGIGDLNISSDFLNSFIFAMLTIFRASFMIIIPIIIILIFVDIILGIISKIIPKINMIVVSFPFKIAVTISLLIISVKIIFTRFMDIYVDFNNLIFKVFSFAPVIFVFSDDKTEEATPHKKKKAKEEGNIAKSTFLVSAISILGVVLVIILGKFILGELQKIMSYFLGDGIAYNYGGYDVVDIFKFVLPKILIVVLIPGIIFIGLSVISNIIQTGFLITPKLLKPNFKDFNPLNTIKNIFSIKSLFDLFRDFIIVIVLCYFSYQFIIDNMETFLRLGNFKTNQSFSFVVPLFISIFTKIFGVVAAIGAVDFMIEKFRYNKKLKMTKQEVKEEFKQMEGDQQVKSQIRQKGKQIIMQNMMSNVKNSSVIITNPTHIAVALRYKQGEDMAPKLMAKGINHVAYRIKELAQENNVPIVEDKQLARFIYKNVELEAEIPQEIYKSVADILTYIFKLNNKSKKY